MNFSFLDLKTKLSTAIGAPDRIDSVGGGDIHKAFKWKTQTTQFFVKVSESPTIALFEAERLGLEILGKNSSFRIPKIEALIQTPHASALVLEWIESRQPGPNSWRIFGEKLADLHSRPVEPGLVSRDSKFFFGLNHPNFIGLLPQSNDPAKYGMEFWVRQRFRPMLLIAQNKNRLTTTELTELQELPDLALKKWGAHPFHPSLVHGDLWNGNLLFDSGGEPVLFDPAVSVSWAEMELSFMELFGGFSIEYEAFYRSHYRGELLGRGLWPLWQLYPLLVHLNMFGRSYAPRVMQAARDARSALL